MLFIKRVTLKNVRCFEFVDLEFDLSGDDSPWTVLIGDNAAGKTTLLRSIAIGLCDESSAAGLLKESDTGYIRRGKKKAEIIIDFCLGGPSRPAPPENPNRDIAGARTTRTRATLPKDRTSGSIPLGRGLRLRVRRRSRDCWGR